MFPFVNKEPKEYITKLEKWLGGPTLVGESIVGWEKSALYDPYILIEVKDEYVKHDFPAPHHDFVTSYAHISLTEKQACDLLKVSGSILIDLLKNVVGARCGGLTANDVTLSFVEDVAEGLTQPTKKEYAKRIKNKIITREKYNASELLKLSERDNKEDNCIIS